MEVLLLLENGQQKGRCLSEEGVSQIRALGVIYSIYTIDIGFTAHE